MTGWPIPDDWDAAAPARIFDRRPSQQGIDRLRRLTQRASAHRAAITQIDAELARRVARTGELLVRHAPIDAGHIPFVLISSHGMFAFTAAGGARNTEDQFAALEMQVDGLQKAVSLAGCTVRGCVVLTQEGAAHTPYYFQGGVIGSAGGYHVGVQHIDTFVELFAGGVSKATLATLRSPDA